MLDLHTHSNCSYDADDPPLAMMEAALARGIHTLGFTEHIDLDSAGITEGKAPADFSRCKREVEHFDPERKGLTVLRGAEVSLQDSGTAARSRELLVGMELDYVIGSVHSVGGMGAYVPEFYSRGGKREVVRYYLEETAKLLGTCPYFQVLGHYDFVCKHAPWEDRALCYQDAPDAFDAIFEHLIAHGQALEINTSSWQERPWGLDVLTRYRELGGELLSAGSDAHSTRTLGNRIPEALELAKRAGFHYITRFRAGRPEQIKIT